MTDKVPPAEIESRNREHNRVAFAWCRSAAMFAETMLDRAKRCELKMDDSSYAALTVLHEMIVCAADELQTQLDENEEA